MLFYMLQLYFEQQTSRLCVEYLENTSADQYE